MAASTYRTQIADRRRKQLLDSFAGINVLPSTCTVPMRILQLQRDKCADMADYADAISADASLSAKLLALTNSAAFRPCRLAGTVRSPRARRRRRPTGTRDSDERH